MEKDRLIQHGVAQGLASGQGFFFRGTGLHGRRNGVGAIEKFDLAGWNVETFDAKTANHVRIHGGDWCHTAPGPQFPPGDLCSGRFVCGRRRQPLRRIPIIQQNMVDVEQLFDAVLGLGHGQNVAGIDGYPEIRGGFDVG